MNRAERAALRAAAEAATPGPWTLTPGREHQVEDHDPVWQDFEIRAADMTEWDGVLSWDPFSEHTTARPEDVAFLALIGPDRILALLDDLELVEAALTRVEALHRPRPQVAIVGECAAENCEHEELHDCETVTIQVCIGCEKVAEAVDDYYMERNARSAEWPCATIRAVVGDAS